MWRGEYGMPETPEEENFVVGTVSELLAKAADHFNKDAFHAAAEICRRLIENDEKLDAAWHILGRVARRAYKTDAAIAYLSTAVKLSPHNPDYLQSLALAQQQAGTLENALKTWAAYDNCTNTRDSVGEKKEVSRFNKAFIHLKLKDYGAAETLYSEPDGPSLADFGDLLLNAHYYREAVVVFSKLSQAKPQAFPFLYKLGLSLHRTGDITAALDAYVRASAIEPDSAQCHQSLCAAYTEANDLDRAIEYGEKAVRRAPNASQSFSNLGIARLKNNEPEAALANLRRAAELAPDNPEILNNLSVACADVGNLADAVHWAQRALTLKPDWADALLNLGNAYRRDQRVDDAVAALRQAAEIESADYRFYLSLGLALLNANRPEDAAACYEHGLELRPEDPELRKGLGIAQLTNGDYRNGWKNYEARLRCAGSPIGNYDAPLWKGEDIAGKELLVYAEQGFGDTIQFCRYLPVLRESLSQNVALTFEVQKPLQGLMQGLCDGQCRLIAKGSDSPAADYSVPLLSLPYLLGTDEQNIPATVPYLNLDNSPPGFDIQKSGFDVGIVWAGNPRRQDDSHRSCPVAALAPLLQSKAANFFSLQMDAAELPSGVTDLTGQIKNFADTARLMQQMDLVITVDTAAAHLAGALGRPVWVMLNYAADWRYQKDRSDSPWYPTMRLFRQTAPGGWRSVIEQILNVLTSDKSEKR